jgi:hypothetical protein
MPKNSKKSKRPAKIAEQTKSYSSVYAAALARQVAAEFAPIRPARKRKLAR